MPDTWHRIVPANCSGETGWLSSLSASRCKHMQNNHLPKEEKETMMKPYTLISPDGKPYESSTPGTLGGHKSQKGYGRLDCPSALRWIAKGYYVRHRVFFADEATAVAARYR